MAILIQFAIGLIFGLGLIVSGMSNPAKVLNFLDLGGIPSGTWDASLAFVMAGAVAVTFVGFNRVLKLARPPDVAVTGHLARSGRGRSRVRRRWCR